jgi:hypothetical protein
MRLGTIDIIQHQGIVGGWAEANFDNFTDCQDINIELEGSQVALSF